MQSSTEQREVLDNETVDSGRRRAIQKIAVSVGVLAGCSMLPDKWTRPIIGQILLPAHAATSGSVLNDPCQVALQAGSAATETVSVRVTGFVTPPAANLPVLITATATGGSNAQVQAQVETVEDGTFAATLNIGGGPGITSVAVETRVTGAAGVARCQVSTESGDDVQVTGTFSWESQLIGKNASERGLTDSLAQVGSSRANFLVSDAQAGQAQTNLLTSLCVNLDGNGNASAVMTIDGLNPGPWSGSGTIADGVMMPFESDILIQPGDYLVVRYYVHFVSISSAQVVVDIDVDGGGTVMANVTLTPSNDSCSLPK